MCNRNKWCHDTNFRPTLAQNFGPFNAPGDILQADLFGKLPNSDSYMHIVTATDIFLRQLFAIRIGRPDATVIVKTLLTVFTQHAKKPHKMIIDNGSFWQPN